MIFGLDVCCVCLWVFVCCLLLIGVLVLVSGVIGFVGFMLLYVVCLLVGVEYC